MNDIRIVAKARSKAAPSVVFELLKDGATWPYWSMFDSFKLERAGYPDSLGIGAIRVFRTKVTCSREEVVELIPGRRLSYILLSGFPFRNYRADVDLEQADEGGTVIIWASSFQVRYLGSGWFWRFLMTRVLQRAAAQLASGAENPRVVEHLSLS